MKAWVAALEQHGYTHEKLVRICASPEDVAALKAAFNYADERDRLRCLALKVALIKRLNLKVAEPVAELAVRARLRAGGSRSCCGFARPRARRTATASERAARPPVLRSRRPRVQPQLIPWARFWVARTERAFRDVLVSRAAGRGVHRSPARAPTFASVLLLHALCGRRFARGGARPRCARLTRGTPFSAPLPCTLPTPTLPYRRPGSIAMAA